MAEKKVKKTRSMPEIPPEVVNCQKHHLDGVPESKKGILETAYFGKSKAAALKAKCLDCMGFEDTTKRIASCSCYICPLWPYRPYQIKRER